MKIINNVNKYEIKTGDVIEWNDGIFVQIIYDKFNNEYPYRLLDMENNEIVDGYKNLCELQEDYTTVISKSENIEIILN